MEDLIQLLKENEISHKKGDFSQYLKIIKSKVGHVDDSQVKEALRLLIDPMLEYEKLVGVSKLLEKLDGDKGLRVAVLGSGTLNQTASLIKTFLFYYGYECEIYQGLYNNYFSEIVSDDSGLKKFRPDLIVLLVDHRDITNILPVSASSEELAKAVDSECQKWKTIWGNIESSYDCPMIQNTYDYFPHMVLGNLSFSYNLSPNNQVDEMNNMLRRSKPAWLYFHDLKSIVYEVGLREWYDPRFYYHSKQTCSLKVLPKYSYSLASIASSIFGYQKKCLVLDLDNTLWGGIVGDDGIDGISIGQGDAQSEAYYDFQKYLLKLKERGIILAVCSKNEEAIAKKAFQEKNMPLKLEDISCFVANWEDKPTNIRNIAKRLNIGIDSLVFVDDNPVERAMVKKYLPEVEVPEMPEDPSEYSHILQDYRYFEPLVITPDDISKTSQYQTNAKREEELKTAGSDITKYLVSLEMKGVVKKFNKADVQRIHQLLNKTNQFNLTTRRYTLSEVEERMNSNNYICLSVRLEDKFGDNGLISVIMGEKKDDTVDIEAWVMSCRVFSRGLEDYFFNKFVEEAKEQGFSAIGGEYLRTNRNGVVESLYDRLGLVMVEGGESGNKRYKLQLAEFINDLETCIDEG